MSLLTIHPENGPDAAQAVHDPDAIAAALAEIGVMFEQWSTDRALPADSDQASILEAYESQVQRLKAKYGFQSADVISVDPDHPQKTELRSKFLNEHTHSDFEVRFFVEGRGLFYLHPDERVFMVLCEQGDLISVPDNVRHWFDMGATPHLKCIRLFTTPEGWVADFTGDPIASRFPTLDEFRARYA